MANIVTVTEGLPSVVYPSVELARRLAAAGHHVTFAGHPDAHGLVSDHALAFIPLKLDHDERLAAADASRTLVDRWRNRHQRRLQAAASLGMDHFRRELRKSRADLVLINGEMHPHIIAASAAGLRIALLNSFVSIWRQPGLPPPHHLARPGVGWRGTPIGASLLWTNLRAAKLRRRLLAHVRHAGCDRVSILRTLAQQEGFDFDTETDDRQWLIPFTYKRVPVLSLHALEFEFPHHPPPHVHYVGPMILKSRSDRPVPAADRARLDVLFDRRRASGGIRKLIYAGFGSALSAHPALLRRLAHVVHGRPNWDLVVSLSQRAAASSLGLLPERIHTFTWVPQQDVLANADAAVTHGGINTIDECVLHDVPSLVYCGGETDMAGTTSRVVHHGIGIAGNGRRDTTDTMRAHLDCLLADDTIKANVRRMHARYTAYVDGRIAERVVASLLEQPVARPALPGMAPGCGDTA